MLKPSSFILLFLLSVANCQFYYNYEEDSSDEPEPSAYQYNTPSAVNHQFTQMSRRDSNPSATDREHRRNRIRIRSRTYNSDPEYNDPQNIPAPESNVDQRTARHQRRQARRRQRQRDYVQPTLPPRIYSPSVFENIGLGEAPSGIYIPQDSFLNVLRSPSRRVEPANSLSQQITSVPHATNYVLPPGNSVESVPQQSFFVQPPSTEKSRQTNLILPQIERVSAVSRNRQTRQRVRIQPEYAAPPTVDIDSLREYTDDVSRENVMSQVQYVQPRTHSRQRKVTTYRETTFAPRVYSPSVFEKVGLGEAPTGIFIPEDSLINVLRNPSEQRRSHRESRQEPIQLSTYNPPEEYVEEIAEEERYQPPPPPPLSPRRYSSQRSRKTPRESDNQGYHNEQQVEPSVQSSSQRQSQRRNNEYEDFERQKAPVQRQTQVQRRQPPASNRASGTRTQASSSDSRQTTFRKAKLTIAELPSDTDDDGIPGEAGVNYPTLHVIPKTAFSCAQQPHNGYYADLETSCQVVHLCQSGGVQNSFLCPNGTIFSQEKFSCQWWYKVNCSDAPKFYIKNDELYKVPERKERN